MEDSAPGRKASATGNDLSKAGLETCHLGRPAPVSECMYLGTILHANLKKSPRQFRTKIHGLRRKRTVSRCSYKPGDSSVKVLVAQCGSKKCWRHAVAPAA